MLFPGFCPMSLLFYTAQDHLSTVPQALPHQSAIRKCPTDFATGNLMGAFSQLRFLQILSDKSPCRDAPLCHCYLGNISSIFCKLGLNSRIAGSTMLLRLISFFLSLTFRVILGKDVCTLIRPMLAYMFFDDVYHYLMVPLVFPRCFYLEVIISPLILAIFFPCRETMPLY